MTFDPTPIPGCVIIGPTWHTDERGGFTRTWDADLLEAFGVSASQVQCSLSRNEMRGTLRGMHWQEAPYAEAKIVRCTRGAIWDVCVDLRPDSPTYLEHAAADLTADNARALVVPEGCAHGFITRANDTDVMYHISAPYRPEAARGARYDDPAFGIDWPETVTVIKDRDATYPDFEVQR